jgi:hypothetical protein
MFFKAFVATLALIGAVSAALPSPNNGASTPEPLCCESVEDASKLDTEDRFFLTILHVDIPALNGLVGFGCKPIEGDVKCDKNAVQCDGLVPASRPLFLRFLSALLLTHTLS